MSVVLLIVHGLLSVVLLGALTHQGMGLLRAGKPGQPAAFLTRYRRAGRGDFAAVVALSYVATFVLGALIYPAYRLDARIAFEDMPLLWAVGVFEVKEHLSAIGLGLLPLYVQLCRVDSAATHRRDRAAVVCIMLLIAWWNFIVGHVLNNVRGIA